MKSFVLLIFLMAAIVAVLLEAGNKEGAMQKVTVLPWWEMTPQEVRKGINQRIMAIEAPTPAVGSVVDHFVNLTPIRIYTPVKEKHLRVVLLIHGGAWVAGNLDTHDHLARYLCSEAEAKVISVGYQNVPEGKFPLQIEQSYEVLCWIEENYPATKIAVVGDSSGGNMSAVLCLMARDRAGPKIDLQVLINPAVDLSCKGTLERQDDSLDILRWQAIQYLLNPEEATHPYVSPLLAPDLTNLPPAVILLAELDDLRESGQRYADRLQAANVPTQIYCQPGVNHLAGHAARVTTQAKESIDVTVKALREAFNGP